MGDTQTLVAAGLMSGTSMDGIDAALIATDGETLVKDIGSAGLRYDPEFKLLLRSAERAAVDSGGDLKKAGARYREAALDYLRTAGGSSGAGKGYRDLCRYFHGNEREPVTFEQVIERSTELHVKAVELLLKETGYNAKNVDLVGYHGQTLFHRPQAGITVQAGYGDGLANQTSIPVVFDFRSNDVAHGGQGAPFAPLYHAALARQNGLVPVVVANCGGIANITLITGRDEELLAFDTGPGNTLIDRFVNLRAGRPCDQDGAFGMQGQVHEPTLRALRKRALRKSGEVNYLDLPPPKSLDVNDLELPPELDALSLQDGCATLEAFTAACIVESLTFVESRGLVIPPLWVVAGGGWQNKRIFLELQKRLEERIGREARVQHADQVGWSGQALEAQIFAYLAVRSLKKLPLSLPGTTGVPMPLTGGTLAFPGDNKRNASERVRQYLED